MIFPIAIAAQNSGDYIQDNNINKFIGNWLWKSGNSSLLLTLEKAERVKLVSTVNVQLDILYGYHKYIKNDSVVENSLEDSDTGYDAKKHTLLGSSDKKNSNLLTGSFIHTSKNKSIRFEIEYIDSTHIKLIKLENYEGVRVDVPGKPPYDSTISLPSNIILTKQ